jgi:hypothetical protein
VCSVKYFLPCRAVTPCVMARLRLAAFALALNTFTCQSQVILPRFEVRINAIEDQLVPCRDYKYVIKGALQGLPEVCCPPNVRDCKQQTDFQRQKAAQSHDEKCWKLNDTADWVCKDSDERVVDGTTFVCCVDGDQGTCVPQEGVALKATEGIMCRGDLIWTGPDAKQCPPGYEDQLSCCCIRAASCYDQTLIRQGLDVRILHADTHVLKEKLDITKPMNIYYTWPTFTNNSWSKDFFGAERALDFDPSTYWCTRPVEYVNPASGETIYFFNNTLPSRWVVDLGRPVNVSGIDIIWKFPGSKFDVYASRSDLPRSIDYLRVPIPFRDLFLGDTDGKGAEWEKVYSEEKGIGREMLQPLATFEAREIAFVFYEALSRYDGCKTGRAGTQPLVAVSEFHFYGEKGELLNAQKPFIQGAVNADTVFHVRDPCEWDGIDCKLAEST